MRFMHPERDEALELSLDDVFIVPGSFEGGSRLQVDITPTDFVGGSHPVVSANMNAVTGKRMAETMARFGGLGVLPQDMDLRTVERIVGHIKAAHPRIDTPLVVTPQATLRDVQGIIRKRSHDMVVVADDDGRLIGVITHADLRERDQYTPAHRLVSRTLVTLAPELTNREAFELLDRSHVRGAPVVDPERRVLGVLTRDDAVRLELLKASLDPSGRLMVAAALGISSEVGERARRLVELGVDALVLDTAHGFQRRMLEAIRTVRKTIGERVPLVAGNVCTAEGTRALIEAGADVVKVNIGPGAMCTTRMQTGVGRPTFSSVLDCAREAARAGKHVWADGGVRYPRDVALYLPPARRASWSGPCSRAPTRARATSSRAATAACSRSTTAWPAAAPSRTAPASSTPSSAPSAASSARGSPRRRSTCRRAARASAPCSSRSSPASRAPAPTWAPATCAPSRTGPSSACRPSAGSSRASPAA